MGYNKRSSQRLIEPNFLREHYVMPWSNSKLVPAHHIVGSEEEPVLLEPLKRQWLTAIVLSALTPLISFVGYAVLGSFQGPFWAWILWTIGVLFLLLVSVVGCIDTWKKLFNVKPMVSLSKRKLHLGDSVEIRWMIDNDSQPLKRLQIWLVGVKEKSSRSRRDSLPTEQGFFTQSLIDTTEPYAISEGKASFLLPSDGFPSGRIDGYDYSWRIQVRGDSENWSDIEDFYPIEVLANPVSS